MRSSIDILLGESLLLIIVTFYSMRNMAYYCIDELINNETYEVKLM